jgi:hypothetical protein
MSRTYKTTNYLKARKAFREGENSSGISTFWDYHRFQHIMSPRGSKIAKYIIQTKGHHARRTAERNVIRKALSVGLGTFRRYTEDTPDDLELEERTCDVGQDYQLVLYRVVSDHEEMDYDLKLSRYFSDPYDYD